MLKRLDITKNVHRFYVGQQRARICCQPLLRSAGGEDETVCCTLPPESFFQPFTWIVEVREVQHQSLVYSTALSLADGEERGRLFTSAGLFVIGKGLQLGIDVKSRLQPAQASLGGNAKALPRDRRREGHPGVGGGLDGGRACGVVRVRGRGGGAHAHRCRRVKMGRRSGAWRCEEERETGGGEEMASEEVARSGWGRAMGAGATDTTDNEEEEEEEDGEEEGEQEGRPALLFTLGIYDRERGRSACLVRSRLEAPRPPPWEGRCWDGAFSGPGGGATTVVVLDPTHSLRVAPVVEMGDWADKTFLLRIRVDLQICPCRELEGATEGCHCPAFKGLGMIHREGAWMLLRDLLVHRLAWF